MRSAFVLVLCCVGAPFAGAQLCPVFEAEVEYLGGGGQRAIAVADLDGDGTPDLVVLKSSQVTVMLGAGGGSFGAATDFQLSRGLSGGMALADFDGDGALDVAAANGTISSLTPGIDVLLGQGDGTFGAASGIPAGLRTSAVVAADFDEDGDVDLLVTSEQDDDVKFLHGNGDGSFAAAVGVPVLGIDPRAMTHGDLDGDGHLDLLVAADYAPTIVSVLLGAGDGTFAPAVGYSVGTCGEDVELSDLDGDGALDLVCANVFSDDLSVRLGVGDGTFGSESTVAIGRPVALAIADLDDDGAPDLVVPRQFVSQLVVLRGDGTGSFGPPEVSSLHLDGVDVALADLDGDGALDAALAKATNFPSVLLGTGVSQASWSDLGNALAGSAGLPSLTTSGCLVDGAAGTLVLEDALAGASATLVIGATAIHASFKGGVIVPSPDLVATFTTGGGGAFVLPFTTPSGLPLGFEFFLQYWIVDPAGPKGLAASNALRGEAQ